VKRNVDRDFDSVILQEGVNNKWPFSGSLETWPVSATMQMLKSIPQTFSIHEGRIRAYKTSEAGVVNLLKHSGLIDVVAGIPDSFPSQ